MKWIKDGILSIVMIPFIGVMVLIFGIYFVIWFPIWWCKRRAKASTKKG